MYKFAINRPIATLMYVVMLLIIGSMAFKSMPTALFPNIDFPIVTIRTAYPGAEPSTIETQVTDKVEEAVSEISGVEMISSTSSNGVSVVMVKFVLERNIEEAANDVRDKISAIQLPTNAKQPLVSKLDVGSAPIINVFVSNKHSTQKELMMFANDVVKPTLQKANGVGRINLIGYRERAIKILPNPYLLTQFGLSVSDLNNIMLNENIKLSGGKLISNTEELVLKTKSDALSVEQLKNTIIKDGIRLQDVATVEDGLSDAQSYSSYNNKQGVMLEVQKISGTNTLEIVDAIKNKLPSVYEKAGDKFQINVLNDTSIYIKHSLRDVEFDLVYGAFLAAIIVFLFLRNVTITLVSALSIPVSIVGTFALMDYMGYDLNKMTMIGLTLAIGIIIDDAIVVIENINKKIEEGMDKFSAAVEGTKEMAFAILAISSMLLAVFIPVSFMGGIVGRFFNSFAMTVGFAIIISYSVALSLIPSLSARVLNNKASNFHKKTEHIFEWIENKYVNLLKKTLNNRKKTIFIVFIIFVFSLSLFPKIGMDFIPKEDKSEFEIQVKANAGISLEEMTRECQAIQNEVKKDKNIEFTTLGIGYSSAKEIHKGLIYVKLKEINERDLNQEEIIQALRAKLDPFKKKLFISIAAIPNIKGAGVSVPYQLVLKSDSLEKLSIAKNNISNYLSKKQGIVDIDSNLEDKKPQLEITILRERAAKMGISAKDISNLIRNSFSGEIEISKLEENGKEYNIFLRLPDEYRTDVADLKMLQIKSPLTGELVFLDGLIDIKRENSMATINRTDRERQVTIFADLFGIDLGTAVSYTEAKIDSLLPKGVSYRFVGFADEMKKTASEFGAALFLSIIFMYVILAVLYESLIQPFIIMVALPLSIAGVLIALLVSGNHFSLFVMIGFMLLMGMVGKNAVLLVDFANHAVANGKNINDALVEAGKKRLRPILMTTMAMVFAMLPLALSSAVGSEVKSPMAISIVGGLVSSMVLTLLVVPAIYYIFAPLDNYLRKWYEGKIKE
ncbi:MAG: efflux RND transporter permease subunit [Sulfurovaceae bacterium]|nr:efflux RND transporter permease subunit [Sulfurovaceae bacterium]MDD5548567.1 efflux RND transporter permease subunit [Sulfurovaceae bacterium]